MSGNTEYFSYNCNSNLSNYNTNLQKLNIIIKGPYIAHIEFTTDRQIPAIPVELTSTFENSIMKPYIAWIDTGATHTTISKKIFDETPLLEVGTADANGPLLEGQSAEGLKICRVLFRIVGTDNSEFNDTVDVLVSNKEFQGYDILLGLDILYHARLEYNGHTKNINIFF